MDFNNKSIMNEGRELNTHGVLADEQAQGEFVWEGCL